MLDCDVLCGTFQLQRSACWFKTGVTCFERVNNHTDFSWYTSRWMFPKIVFFFPNHPFSIVFSIYKPSILGAHPYFWKHLFFVTKQQNIRPRKLTWNLKMKPWNRRFLLKNIIFRFHVSFRQTWVPSQCQSVYPRTWTKTFKTKEQTQPGRHVACWAMAMSGDVWGEWVFTQEKFDQPEKWTQHPPFSVEW